MQLYVIHDDAKGYTYEADEVHYEWAWASSADEALALARAHGGFDAGTPLEDFDCTLCHTQPDCPPENACIETRAEVLRRAGCALEGEVPCAICDLAANGIAAYQVCTVCERCEECGHDQAAHEDYSLPVCRPAPAPDHECHIIYEFDVVRYWADSLPDHSQYPLPADVLVTMNFETRR